MPRTRFGKRLTPPVALVTKSIRGLNSTGTGTLCLCILAVSPRCRMGFANAYRSRYRNAVAASSRVRALSALSERESPVASLECCLASTSWHSSILRLVVRQRVQRQSCQARTALRCETFSVR